MSEVNNAIGHKAIVRAFFEAVDRLDRDALNEIYHDDFALEYPGNTDRLNRDEHWALMNGYHVGFPDMVHRPDIIVEEGNLVCVRGTVTGTNTGSLLGQEPTGAATSVQFLNMMTFRDGKLLSIFSLIDQASLQKQLGLAKVLFVKD